MKRIIYLILFFSLTFINCGYSDSNDVIIITHKDVPEIDANDLKNVYLGKLYVVKNINLLPVNSQSGSLLKKEFLQKFINQDEDAYIGYWTVRRYIGKGVPPIEINSQQEIISFVENHAGAIGYIDKVSTLAINNSSIKILTY